MNKRGFMMAELVVVSSIVIVTLVGLYASYNKIYTQYNTILGYNDVTLLYRLGYYRDILRENEILDDTMNEAKINDVVLVYSKNNSGNNGNLFSLDSVELPNDDYRDIVYFIYNNKGEIDKSKLGGLNNTFYDYIDYFNNSVKYNEFSYVMIMERCYNDDNCKYAYLEMPETK